MFDWLRTALVVIVLVCSAIIGVSSYLQFARTDNPEGTEARAGGNATPETLPEFTLNDMWGEPHSIREWGGKPLLINFWATWCAPCRREMPLLDALHVGQDNLQVLGIAIDRVADVQTYMAEAGIRYPTLVGEEDAMRVSDLFGLEGLGLPFTVLVGRSGEVLTVFIGEIDADQLATMSQLSAAYDSGQLSLAKARDRLAEL